MAPWSKSASGRELGLQLQFKRSLDAWDPESKAHEKWQVADDNNILAERHAEWPCMEMKEESMGVFGLYAWRNFNKTYIIRCLHYKQEEIVSWADSL